MAKNWIELSDCRSYKLAGTVLTKSINKTEVKYFNKFVFLLEDRWFDPSQILCNFSLI